MEGENLRKHVAGLSEVCLLTEKHLIGGAFQEVVIKRNSPVFVILVCLLALTCAGVLSPHFAEVSFSLEGDGVFVA